MTHLMFFIITLVGYEDDDIEAKLLNGRFDRLLAEALGLEDVAILLALILYKSEWIKRRKILFYFIVEVNYLYKIV